MQDDDNDHCFNHREESRVVPRQVYPVAAHDNRFVDCAEVGQNQIEGNRECMDAFDWEHARAELGIWLVPQVRGRGLGSRALWLVGAWLFGATPLARLQLMTDPDNEAMVRAARSAGLRLAGD